MSDPDERPAIDGETDAGAESSAGGALDDAAGASDVALGALVRMPLSRGGGINVRPRRARGWGRSPAADPGFGWAGLDWAGLDWADLDWAGREGGSGGGADRGAAEGPDNTWSGSGPTASSVEKLS